MFTVHTLTIHTSDEDSGRPLQISHAPTMLGDDADKVGLAIKVRYCP